MERISRLDDTPKCTKTIYHQFGIRRRSDVSYGRWTLDETLQIGRTEEYSVKYTFTIFDSVGMSGIIFLKVF